MAQCWECFESSTGSCLWISDRLFGSFGDNLITLISDTSGDECGDGMGIHFYNMHGKRKDDTKLDTDLERTSKSKNQRANPL